LLPIQEVDRLRRCATPFCPLRGTVVAMKVSSAYSICHFRMGIGDIVKTTSRQRSLVLSCA
jgi:hypothetical protein